MGKKDNLIDSRLIIASWIFLLTMMIIGSFFDYQISLGLFNPNSAFGCFFAAFGEYPTALGFAASGTLLIKGRNKDKKALSIVQIILGVYLMFLGFGMATFLPMLNMELTLPLAAIIGVISTALTVWGINLAAKDGERRTIIRISLLIILVIFLDILIVNFIKIPWGRARMRLVAVDERAYFMPWWKGGKALKDTLVPLGVNSEEFKSFPSGHTADASVILVFSLLPLISKKLEGKGNIIYIAGFIWTLLVGLSRIIMGAHYLTDTTVGFAIGLGVFLLSSRILLPRKE